MRCINDLAGVIPRHEGSPEVLFKLILSFTDPRETLIPIAIGIRVTAVPIYVISRHEGSSAVQLDG